MIGKSERYLHWEVDLPPACRPIDRTAVKLPQSCNKKIELGDTLLYFVPVSSGGWREFFSLLRFQVAGIEEIPCSSLATKY